MISESSCTWKYSMGYIIWKCFSCNCFNVSSPQCSTTESNAGGAEFQGKMLRICFLLRVNGRLGLRSARIWSCFWVFYHAAFQLFVYELPNRKISECGTQGIGNSNPVVGCAQQNAVDAVTVLQSMETSYERGLIRHKSLKQQRLNMFLVINYCFTECIHTYVCLQDPGPFKKENYVLNRYYFSDYDWRF